MAVNKQQVWFITGCSKGLGRDIAEAALAKGCKVVATARRKQELDDLVAEFPDMAMALGVDVKNDGQISDAVSQAVAKFGTIDVLINNAGHGLLGAFEEVSDAEARALFDVNVFGLLAVTRAILPVMRKQNSGHIINMSSISGLVANPGAGLYGASKHAVEAISEALLKELAPFGINVSVVEPGPVRTDFAGGSMMLAEQIADYKDTPAHMLRQHVTAFSGKQPGDPLKVAQAVINIAGSDAPPFHLVLGTGAFEGVRDKLENFAKELETWEEVSRGIDYPGESFKF